MQPLGEGSSGENQEENKNSQDNNDLERNENRQDPDIPHTFEVVYPDHPSPFNSKRVGENSFGRATDSLNKDKPFVSNSQIKPESDEVKTDSQQNKGNNYLSIDSGYLKGELKNNGDIHVKIKVEKIRTGANTLHDIVETIKPFYEMYEYWKAFKEKTRIMTFWNYALEFLDPTEISIKSELTQSDREAIQFQIDHKKEIEIIEAKYNECQSNNPYWKDLNNQDDRPQIKPLP